MSVTGLQVGSLGRAISASHHRATTRSARATAAHPSRAAAVMEKVTFGDNLPGLVAGSVASPAVIVIQEWWGITPVIEGHALKIAEAGYRVLIPDIYKGKIGVDKEEASHLLNTLDWQAAVAEITQAADYLKAQGAEKVGAVGFCMGGALSLAAAQHSGVACAAPFYGLPQAGLCQPENVKVPVLMSTGDLDEFKGFSDAESFKVFAAKVNEAGGQAELHIFPNCGHAFLNTGEEGVAKRQHMGFPEPPAELQELAWQNLFEFFSKHLKE